MARLPLAITPRKRRCPGGEPCTQCADARQDAVEKTARKRTRKPAAEAPQETSEAPDGEESAPASDL